MKLNIKKAKMNDRLLSRKHSKSVSDNSSGGEQGILGGEQQEERVQRAKKPSAVIRKPKTPVKVPVKKESSNSSPSSAEEIEEMGGFVDAFIVETDAFDGRAVYSVELPKMLFKSSSSSDAQLIKERSSILISLVSIPESIEDGLFKSLMTATKKNKISLGIKWVGIPEGNILSHWKFVNPRIAAIDMGTCAYEEREEPMQILVEIEYDTLNVDGVEV